VRNLWFMIVALCSSIMCASAGAAKFSWVASANTTSVSVDELASGLSNGITESCAQAYPMTKYGFYVIGTDYLSPKEDMYVYSVTVTLSKKGSQGDVPPVDSFSFSGYRAGGPPVVQRRQMLVQAAQVAASELCRRLSSKR
jgi:hypothetical protein